jgi:hypothetical protein
MEKLSPKATQLVIQRDLASGFSPQEVATKSKKLGCDPLEFLQIYLHVLEGEWSLFSKIHLERQSAEEREPDYSIPGSPNTRMAWLKHGQCRLSLAGACKAILRLDEEGVDIAWEAAETILRNHGIQSLSLALAIRDIKRAKEVAKGFNVHPTLIDGIWENGSIFVSKSSIEEISGIWVPGALIANDCSRLRRLGPSLVVGGELQVLDSLQNLEFANDVLVGKEMNPSWQKVQRAVKNNLLKVKPKAQKAPSRT